MMTTHASGDNELKRIRIQFPTSSTHVQGSKVLLQVSTIWLLQHRLDHVYDNSKIKFKFNVDVAIFQIGDALESACVYES
ncbi:hypothetical protein TSUD_41650 [Trifolium subterraneum]|nr:hypothetical protein TSUD_41650 [Trifolium subterraneum]